MHVIPRVVNICMKVKKPKQSKMEPEILSQCPECLGIEMTVGGTSYRVMTRPSVVFLKGSVEQKLCPKCVERLRID